jgi:hypothetical protein
VEIRIASLLGERRGLEGKGSYDVEMEVGKVLKRGKKIAVQ